MNDTSFFCDDLSVVIVCIRTAEIWHHRSHVAGVRTHYISRTGAWDSFSQFTLALRSLWQHTCWTLLSPSRQDSWDTYFYITIDLFTKGLDVHFSVNERVFAQLIQSGAKCSALRNVIRWHGLPTAIISHFSLQLFTSIQDWRHVLYARERHVLCVNVC